MNSEKYDPKTLAHGQTTHTHTHMHIPCLSTCLVNASCSCMLFYSWYRGYSHSQAIIFLCKPPVQVWLGLDNRKSAWRGDTTPQDVIEAIIMLSRRDVQELRLWRCSRNTSPLGACRNVAVVTPQLQNWKAEFWSVWIKACFCLHSAEVHWSKVCRLEQVFDSVIIASHGAVRG